MGTKYMIQDHDLVGWRDDDLSMFGLVRDIAVLNNNVLFVVKLGSTCTLVINCHYHIVNSRTNEIA